MTDTLREALEDMIWQFAYRGVRGRKPMLMTGGLSALEGAFEALGWADPHYVDEENTCNVTGCHEWASCGMNWGNLYLNLCSEHHRDAFNGKPMPEIKPWALKREATRSCDKVSADHTGRP